LRQITIDKKMLKTAYTITIKRRSWYKAFHAFTVRPTKEVE